MSEGQVLIDQPGAVRGDIGLGDAAALKDDTWEALVELGALVGTDGVAADEAEQVLR